MRLVNLILTCLLLPAFVAAQVRISNLQDLFAYADEHSAGARQAKLMPRIAQQDVRIQSSGLYPRINVFAAGDYYPLIPVMVLPAEVLGGAPGTYMKAQFGLPYVFQAGAELSIPVIDLEKWAQLQRLRAQYTQSEWSSKAMIEQLHLQLMQSYYQLLVMREVALLNDENIVTVNELARIMDERKEAGILEPSDHNRSINLKLNTETSAVDYQTRVQQSTNSLKALVNIPGDLEIAERLTDFDWPSPQQAVAISGRPGWQEVASKVRMAELALNESKKGGLPKLNLNSRYAYNMQSKFESGAKNVEFQTATIGLRVDMPVFRGNYYRSLQKKNQLQLLSALLEKERTEAILEQQQADWFNQYRSAYLKHSVSEQKVKTTSDNLRIARLNVKEGVMEFDEFNNIFMEYNRAKMEHLQNLADGVLYYLLSTQKF